MRKYIANNNAIQQVKTATWQLHKWFSYRSWWNLFRTSKIQ